MIEEIKPGLFRIEVPLPRSPLKTLNSYVIRSPERNLIVDTGFNRKECLQAMQAGLSELGVDRARTDIFITHFHTDHFGLIGELATENSKVYFNRPEVEWMINWGGWEKMLDYGALSGFPRAELEAALNQHPGARFNTGYIPELTILDDGDEIRVGDYAFKCILTPGHSPGHICLYEPDKKFLISGDHVLGDITPNIQCWADAYDPLGDYLVNLKKVRALSMDLMLPGHRSLIADPYRRIDELEAHHQRRLDEIVSILAAGGASHAYEVASHMTWDIEAESWDKFPLSQKWFATGESIAHLRYLEEAKTVYREKSSERIIYALSGASY